MYFPSMDFHSKVTAVLALSAITLLLNLPFGYARAKAKKYSLRWFLYIHIPIPFIFIARVLSHIEIKYIPFLALAAIIGQLAGGKLEL
jgi:type III secretory pathway component EscU